MKRNAKQINVCQQCGKTFYSSRHDAKFCHVNCRMMFFRIAKSGNGKTWHHVSEPGKKMATDIKSVSDVAFEAISGILREYGARAAENAIMAAYSAAMACLEQVEAIRR